MDVAIHASKESLMRQKINKEVSIVSFYNSRKQIAQPYVISWNNQDHTVGEIGYHHKIYDGKICHHIFFSDIPSKHSAIIGVAQGTCHGGALYGA